MRVRTSDETWSKINPNDIKIRRTNKIKHCISMQKIVSKLSTTENCTIYITSFFIMININLDINEIINTYHNFQNRSKKINIFNLYFFSNFLCFSIFLFSICSNVDNIVTASQSKNYYVIIFQKRWSNQKQAISTSKLISKSEHEIAVRISIQKNSRVFRRQKSKKKFTKYLNEKKFYENNEEYYFFDDYAYIETKKISKKIQKNSIKNLIQTNIVFMKNLIFILNKNMW